jgi:hypothetical protein
MFSRTSHEVLKLADWGEEAYYFSIGTGSLEMWQENTSMGIKWHYMKRCGNSIGYYFHIPIVTLGTKCRTQVCSFSMFLQVFENRFSAFQIFAAFVRRLKIPKYP